jgi:RNase P/RNase MRP subunit p30
VLQSYDLVAAQAATAEAFALLCESDAVDIITIDLANRLPFHIAAKHTSAALAHNIHFEVRRWQTRHEARLARRQTPRMC